MVLGIKRPGAHRGTPAGEGLSDPLPLEEALKTICWPLKPDASIYCRIVERELKEFGVRHVYSYGDKVVAGMRVLGRGWSSIVVLVETPSGKFAAKIARPHGRRATLLWEAAAWTLAAGFGAAPRIHGVSVHTMLIEFIQGPRLRDYKPRSCWEAWVVLRRIIVKTHLLDKARLRHSELARPHDHIVLDKDLEPYIVDYESARLAEKPGNTSQVVAGLQTYPWAKAAMPGLASLQTIRGLLKRHKRDPTAEALEELLEALGTPVDHTCPP